jgi:hypothetical protein
MLNVKFNSVIENATTKRKTGLIEKDTPLFSKLIAGANRGVTGSEMDSHYGENNATHFLRLRELDILEYDHTHQLFRLTPKALLQIANPPLPLIPVLQNNGYAISDAALRLVVQLKKK